MTMAIMQGPGMLTTFQRLIPTVSLSCFVRGFAGMSDSIATGLNINKTGTDPPLKEDKDLPDWLWPLAEPPRSLGDLRRASADSLEFQDLKRLDKLSNREKIRTRNEAKAK